ncbi:MAG: histidine kinase, partial [Synergistaceae bacterium]|nr:histidine kinase [Synergistaceae bacterium]
MIFWFDSFFIYFMMGVTLLVSVIGLWFTAIMPGIDRWSKRFFRSLFTLFILLNIIGFLDTIIYIYPVPMWIMYLMIILESVLLSLSLLMMTAYLLHCCGENVRSNRLFHAVLGLWGVFVVMLTIPLFTEVFYYFTPDGRYWRGAWYPVLLLPMIIAMLLTIAGMIRWRERLSRKAFLSFLITLLPITCVLVMDMFIELYPLIDISIVISALSMYSLILSDQIEQDLQRQREIANQRASIMVLQMRPHFIYNTMTSIYCLCKQDPQLAQQVIMDFTTYL